MQGCDSLADASAGSSGKDRRVSDRFASLTRPFAERRSATDGQRRVNDRAATALTTLLAIAIVLALSWLGLTRRGNLAWDDADYLRRGLANARFAAAAGPLLTLPRAIDRLLLEQPKPPWFVAWIELGVHTFGRGSIDLLIFFSTIVPYSFLMLAVVSAGRWLCGAWGGFLALVCLSASPLSLAFGDRVMVETFLALWLVLIYCLTAIYLTAPSRKTAAMLGLAVGLALLTKLTTVLFLPGPLIYGFVRIWRTREPHSLHRKRLGLAVAVCLAVAGPWYVKNAIPAVKFASFSSKYNEVATGAERVPAARRAAEMMRDLPGWALAGTVGAFVAASALWGRKQTEAIDGRPDPGELARSGFTHMAWLSAGIAALVLLYPAYFDTRFLVPIWPVLAVAIGTSLQRRVKKISLIPKAALGLGFAGSLLFAVSTVAREPSFTTYWQTTRMIEDLVRQFGVSNLANVGNCAAWNVCKTGLMNELRDDPGNCFVLHDLTRASNARGEQILKQADGVIVLRQSDLPEDVVEFAPGLNRGYSAAVDKLVSDPAFGQVSLPERNGMPGFLLFVRKAKIEQAQKTFKFEARLRR